MWEFEIVRLPSTTLLCFLNPFPPRTFTYLFSFTFRCILTQESGEYSLSFYDGISR